METRACNGIAFKPVPVTNIQYNYTHVLVIKCGRYDEPPDPHIIISEYDLSSESIEHPQHMEEKAQRHP